MDLSTNNQPVIDETHDGDFLTGVILLGTITVYPDDFNKVNATCRLEHKGLVKVKRVKRIGQPGLAFMYVKAT